MALSGLSSDGFRTIVQPAIAAAPTLSVTWFIGQFHGVMRPTTPIGSHATMLVGAWSPIGRMNSNLRNSSTKVSMWNDPDPA